MKTLRCTGMAILLALLATALVTGAALAATISLANKSLPPTAYMKITGAAFGDTEIVDIALDGANLGTATTNAAGAFTASVQVPLATKIGKTHTLTATGQTSGLTAAKGLWVRTEWLQSGYDAGHANNSYYENVLNASNVASLIKYWEVPIAGYASQIAVYYGSTTGGAVLVNTTGALQAVHPGNGKILWTFNAPAVPPPASNSLGGTPATAGGRVYVRDRSGTFYALNATTGAILWTAPIDADPHDASPVISKDTVYLALTTGKVYAFDCTSGALRWSTTVTGRDYNGDLGPFTYGNAAVADGLVIVSSLSNLYALDATSGGIKWQIGNPASDWFYQPTVYKGTIYLGYHTFNSNRFRAYRASDGKQLWGLTITTYGGVTPAPAVANGVVYANAGKNVLAFNATSGALLSHIPVNSSLVYSPVIANGLIFLVSGFQLQVYSASDGALLKSLDLNGGNYPVANGMVFVSGLADRSLRAYRLPKALLP